MNNSKGLIALVLLNFLGFHSIALSQDRPIAQRLQYYYSGDNYRVGNAIGVGGMEIPQTDLMPLRDEMVSQVDLCMMSQVQDAAKILVNDLSTRGAPRYSFSSPVYTGPANNACLFSYNSYDANGNGTPVKRELIITARFKFVNVEACVYGEKKEFSLIVDWIQSANDTYKSGPTSICYSGCRYSWSGTPEYFAGDSSDGLIPITMQGEYTSSDQFCSESDPEDEPRPDTQEPEEPPEPCPNGTRPGTVNGEPVCVPSGDDGGGDNGGGDNGGGNNGGGGDNGGGNNGGGGDNGGGNNGGGGDNGGGNNGGGGDNGGGNNGGGDGDEEPTEPGKCPPGQRPGEVNGNPVCVPSGDGGGDGDGGGSDDGGDTGGGDTGGGDNGGGNSGDGDGDGDGDGNTGGGGGGSGDGDGEGDEEGDCEGVDCSGIGPGGELPGSCEAGSGCLYESKYPDGLKGVFETFMDDVKQSPIFNLPRVLLPDFNGGSCPNWSINLNFGGHMNLGSHTLEPPCWIWDAGKAIVLVLALILARRLVFGG